MTDALGFAPPGRPDTGAWVVRLLTGQWSGEEPLVVGLFNLMGVWPLVVATWLGWANLRRWTLGPFVLGSLFLGAFVLLPGLLLTGYRGALVREPWRPLRTTVAVGLALVAAGIAVPSVVLGDPETFVTIWRSDGFVHVMALDFLAFAVTWGVVRRELSGPRSSDHGVDGAPSHGTSHRL
jgi:hypothetical protein